MSATVTSGFDRWRDDQSVFAANDDTGDADAPIAPHEAPNPDVADDPNAAKRFLAYAPFAKQCDFHKIARQVPPVRRRSRSRQIDGAAHGSSCPSQ